MLQTAHLYGPLYALAIGVGAWLFERRLETRGVSWGAALLGVGVVSWAAVAGAFLLHALVAAVPGALPWPGPYRPLSGNTVVGAIVGGALGATFWAALRGESPWIWLDALAGAAPLGQAIGRLGCLSAGCCYGKPTRSWIALRLADSSGLVAARYPTQLMASAAALGIFLTVLLLERRLARRHISAPGLLFGAYLTLYGVKRFLLEFVRATANPILAGLTWAQLGASIFLLVGFTISTTALRSRPDTQSSRRIP